MTFLLPGHCCHGAIARGAKSWVLRFKLARETTATLLPAGVRNQEEESKKCMITVASGAQEKQVVTETCSKPCS